MKPLLGKPRPSERGPWERKVALTAVQCRQYADECIMMAESAGRENAVSLLKMAETWLQLAEQLLTQERPVIGSDQNAPSTDKL